MLAGEPALGAQQLAVIATIFLPPSWLTGFFGQNFGISRDLVGDLEKIHRHHAPTMRRHRAQC